MPYYHLRVKKNSAQWVFAFDFNKQKIVDDILLPFKKHESFMCNSTVVRFSDIDRLGVNETDIPSLEILKKTRAKRIVKKLASNNEQIHLVNAREVVSYGKDVTEELLKELSINSLTTTESDSRVSTSHKSNDKQVLNNQDNKQSLIPIDEQTEHARALLYELENTMRNFVSSKITESNGEIDPEFIKSWESTKRKEFIPPRKPLEAALINYSTFEQLRRIITQNNNWDKIFKKYFGRPNGVISRINEIDEIRDTIAHNRILSDFDYKSFITLYNELMGCLDTSSLRQANILAEDVAKNSSSQEVIFEEETPKMVLLEAGEDITDLQITDKLLNNIYNSAYSQVKKIFPDAKLCVFSLNVDPFAKCSSKVLIMLWFYSKDTDRIPTFTFSDNAPQPVHNLPDNFRQSSMDSIVFSELPWEKSPNWLDMLKGLYRKIGPISPSISSHYTLNVFPSSKRGNSWIFNFDDGFSGRRFAYSWNGNDKEEPINFG